MTVTVTNGAARAVFTANPTASTISHGPSLTVELDSGGAVVAANFTTHGAGVRLVNVLSRDYNMTLSGGDKQAINDAL